MLAFLRFIAILSPCQLFCYRISDGILVFGTRTLLVNVSAGVETMVHFLHLKMRFIDDFSGISSEARSLQQIVYVRAHFSNNGLIS